MTQDDKPRLSIPLARGRRILSVHNLLQATSQSSGPLTLRFSVIMDGLDQRVINRDSMPQKNNKGRGKTTHHILCNQPFQKIGTWAKSSNTSIQTSSHLLALRLKEPVCKTHKGGSSGADIRGSNNNTRHSIHSLSKN